MSLHVDLALAEAEVALCEHLAAARITAPGYRRAPFDHELAAGVRFAELDALVDRAAAKVAGHAAAVRALTLGALEDLAARRAASDPRVVAALLAALANPATAATLPGVAGAQAAAAASMRADLLALAVAGAGEAAGEARRQGVDAVAVRPASKALADTAREQAAVVAAHPAGRLLAMASAAAQRAAARPGATGASVLDVALNAARGAPEAGTVDLARQAANVAHGLGRTAQLVAGPTPARTYASELRDSESCSPCDAVDGREYKSLRAALADYPGLGGYKGCKGGYRCRGSIIAVWDSEAAPSR